LRLQVENWSAFAPDFKELDENVDYEERESEFDLEDEDKSVQMNEEEIDDDIQAIDVARNVPIPAFCSSDEEEEDPKSLLYLPIAPEIEDPEEHWVPGVDGPANAPGKKHVDCDCDLWCRCAALFRHFTKKTTFVQ
jgi:hypothetical protein